MTAEARHPITPEPPRLPASPAGAALLGLLALSACAPREAAPLADVRAHPEQMRALVASAIAAQSDPALAALRRAALAAPSNLALQARYAGALARAGETAAAEGIVTAGLAQSPDHPGLLVELGRLRVRGGQAQVALAIFDRAARLEPGADAEEGRGLALDLLGRHQEAQAAYRAALTLAPERVSVQNNLAMSLLLTGHVGEALALLEPLAQRRDAPARVNNNLAVARTMLGDAPRQDIAADPRQLREVASNLRATVGAAPAQPAPESQFAAGEPGRDVALPLLPLDTPARADWAVASAPLPPLPAAPGIAAVTLPFAQLPPELTVARAPLPTTMPMPAPGPLPEIVTPVALPVAQSPARPALSRAPLPAVMSLPAAGLPPEIVTPVALPVAQSPARAAARREATVAARPALVPSPLAPDVATPLTPPRIGVALAPSPGPTGPALHSGTPPEIVTLATLPREHLLPRGAPQREALPLVTPMMAPGLPPEVVGAPATSPLRASRAQRRSPTAGLPRRLALSLPPEQGVLVPPRRPAAMRRAAPAAIAASPRPAETSSEAAPQARTSGYTVQIAALSSEETARIYWSSVRQDLPGTFGDLAPEIIRADLPHGTFWRLRTGSFATMTDARGFCQAVRSQGRGCWVPGG